MNGLAITNKGMEDVCAKEINELIGGKQAVGDSVVEFELSKLEELCLLCYKSQSASRILYLLSSFSVEKGLTETVEKIRTSLDKTGLGEWIKKDSSFKVECERLGDHDFTSPELEKETGSLIVELVEKKQGFSPKAKMERPSTVFYVYAKGSKGYLGIDFSGLDLGKRDYKLFGTTPGIKAPLAYALIRLAGIEKSQKAITVVDCFSGCGIAVIEAALFLSQFPVNNYRKQKMGFLSLPQLKDLGIDGFFKEIDSRSIDAKAKLFAIDKDMKNLSYAKKNAKIAGINKAISFSRQDLEWLDTRFKKATVNFAISVMPVAGRSISIQELSKMLDEYFYQLDYIMKKDGIVACLCIQKEQMIASAVKRRFMLKEERKLYSGQQEYSFLKLCRDPSAAKPVKKK